MPGPSNVLELGLRTDFADGQTKVNQLGSSIDALTAAVERMGRTQDPFKKINEGASHGVTQVQAASASLRTLEGNIGNNIRAAERFLVSIPGIGQALQAAFPVVGSIALLGVLFELGKKAYEVYQAFVKLAEGPKRVTEEVEKLNYSTRASTDALLVSMDKLNNETAKLLGRPENVLRSSIDETREATDKLGQSLNNALKSLEDLLNKNSVPWWARLLGKAGTDDIAKQISSLQGDINDITAAGQAQIAGAKNPKDVTNAQNSLNLNTMRRYGQTISELNDQLTKAQELQKQHDKAGVTDYLLGPVASDQKQRIANLQAALKEASSQADLAEATHQENQARIRHDSVKASVDDSKKLLEERRQIEEDAARGLQAAVEKEYAGYYKIVETFVQKVNAAHQKLPGAFTAKALADYQQTMTVEMATMQRKDAEKYMNDLQSNAIKANGLTIQSGNTARDFQNEALQAANDETIKEYDFREQRLGEWQTTQLKALDSMNAKTVQQKLSVEQQKLAIEKDFLKQSEDIQIARLDAITAQTKAQFIGEAQERLVKVNNDDDRNSINQTLNDRLETLTENRDAQAAAISGKVASQQQEAIDKATKAQTAVIQEEYKKTYDSVLKQSNSFLEAIEDRSGNAWKRIADGFKKTFLDAFNNVISSSIAKQVAMMVTGQSGSDDRGKAGGNIMVGPSSGVGLLGQLFGGRSAGSAPGVPSIATGSIGGGAVAGTPPFVSYAMPGAGAGVSAPVGFSGTGGGGLFALASAVGGSTMAAAPSVPSITQNPIESGQLPYPTTPSITSLPNLGDGPSGSGGGGGLGGLFGGSGLGQMFKGSNANMLGMAAGGIALMQSLGQKGVGGALAGLGGGASLGYNFSKLAVSNPALAKLLPNAGGTGGMIAGTAAGVGLGMFTQGLSHTGWGGWGETLAGGTTTGAGIGFMAGGPAGALLGAGIGAAVGGIAGLFSLFRENPRDKVKKIVKQSYGLDIDNGVADSIVKMAQETYGGNYALAVSSPQIRQMLAMYAQATGAGQLAQSISPKAVGYQAMSSGGNVTNIASTVDGYSAMNYGGLLPTAMPGGSPNVSLKLDGAATTALLSGTVANVAPSAVANAYAASSGRQSTVSTFFQPGLVVR